MESTEIVQPSSSSPVGEQVSSPMEAVESQVEAETVVESAAAAAAPAPVVEETTSK